MLEEMGAVVCVFLFYTDFDIESYGLPPDRAEGLSNFSRTGIVDVDFDEEPYAIRDSRFDPMVTPRTSSLDHPPSTMPRMTVS